MREEEEEQRRDAKLREEMQKARNTLLTATAHVEPSVKEAELSEQIHDILLNAKTQW